MGTLFIELICMVRGDKKKKKKLNGRVVPPLGELLCVVRRATLIAALFSLYIVYP